MGRILQDAERFCTEGVTSQDSRGVVRKMVVRLAGFICDRMEAETITDCRPQECFSCFRLSEDNWIPGMQPGDGKRFFQDVQKDILQAKTSGTWSARPGQPGPRRAKKLTRTLLGPRLHVRLTQVQSTPQGVL